MQERIGSFEVLREIGRGGMGVVFLARDTRLDRHVAIKALPEHLASDQGRMERFQREAKTLASLSHPNVAGIHGVEELDGTRYLILEYIEGETLADRLDRGPLAVDDAIEYASQIAAGVAAAHMAGVIHRDLKPANIIITPDGKATVLDFGLAREDETHSSSGDGNSPTIPAQAHSPTIEGTILGTAAYMSPEQARGRRVDHRSDVWSFGAMLYEMLVGTSPFQGETATDSIGAVLHKQIELDRLPPNVPARVRRVLHRCLHRDKNRRYHAIIDARMELLSASVDQGDDQPMATGGASRWLLAAGWLVAFAAITGVILLAASPASKSAEAVRIDMDIFPRDGYELSRLKAPPRLSPDSSKLAFLVYPDSDSQARIAVRDLHTGEEWLLRGPQNPRSLVWTSDSRSVMYIADQGIGVMDVFGGRPQILSTERLFTQSGRGAIDRSGRFVFSRMRGALMAVTPETGEFVELIDPIPEREGDWAVAPSFLPDGKHVLYSNQDDDTMDSGLYVGSLADGSSRRLLPFETSCVFVEPDIVVYWRDADLFAQRFNLHALALIGEPIRVAESVLRRDWPMFGIFDATADTLTFVPRGLGTVEESMVLLDMETGEETEVGVEGSLWTPKFSPDGTRVVYDRTVDATAGDIVVHDLNTGQELVLSDHEANESLPVWHPEGQTVYFYRGPDNVYQVPADGSQPATLLHSGQGSYQPWDVSPDGTKLLIKESDFREHVSLLDLHTGEVTPLPPDLASARGFTPDGEWLVYINVDSGEERVVAGRIDGTGSHVDISQGFGVLNHVSGEWVYFKTRTNLVRVRVRSVDDQLVVSDRERITNLIGLKHVAGSPDGTKLIMLRAKQPGRGGSIRVIRNWIPDSLR